jgi:hypothetical protein
MGGGGGPSILSRGGSMGKRGGRDPIFLRAYGDLGYTYDAGINPLGVDSAGRLQNVGIQGIQASFGAYMRRDFRRTSATLDFRGDARHYPSNSFWDGSDQYLNLSVERQLTRRWQFGVQGLAGTLSRANGGYVLTQLADPTFLGVPVNELFDNRSYFAQASAMAAYQPNSRLMFQFGGSGFTTRRRSRLLMETDGYMATGAVQYQLNRSTAIGANYMYTHFDFRRAFGASDLMGYTGLFRKRLSRNSQLEVQVGAFRMESLGSRTVVFDPAIAALTGRLAGVEAFLDVRWLPNLQASWNRRWAKSNFSASYMRTVTPGNGLYLTSSAESILTGLSYTGSRRWNVGTTAGYLRNTAILQGSAQYNNAFAGGGVSYRVNDWIHLNARTDWRRFMVDDRNNYQRNSMRLLLSVGVSPGEFPLTLW